mmetsp:Transcript_34946/g.80812  ORF Transcript_34946/g.80812 Transcript_34946/m.80812 type:complete len:89 (+) Transcript_34946:150-416(+)
MQRTISILSVFTVLLSNAEAFVQQPKFGTRQFTYNLKMAGPEIEVISQPSKDFLEKKGVFNWGTWGCGVSILAGNNLISDTSGVKSQF